MVYCVGDKCIRCSTTLDGVQSNVVGLYEAVCVGVLFSLTSAMISHFFHVFSMMACA